VDGWYQPGWSISIRPRKTNRPRGLNEGRRILAMLGVQFSDDVELSASIPHPIDPRLALGGPSDLSIPENLQDFVTYDASDADIEMTDNPPEGTIFGSPNPWTEIPLELEDFVEFDDNIKLGI